jgi:hypothetical protein
MITFLLRSTVGVLFLFTTALAQIPNAGFEAWGSVDPDGWVTSNAGGYNTVTASATVHSGSHSARGDVISFFTVTLQPILQSGLGGGGFAYTSRPGAFSGYYQFYPTGGDRFAVNVILFKGGIGGSAVASASAALSNTVGSWTQFTVPFNYLTSETPDTCVIQIQIIGPDTGTSSSPHVGSYFLLDDLSFSGATGVAQGGNTQPASFSLAQNYPNPFNPSTIIEFSLPLRSSTRLIVYNLLGQEVARLVNGEVGEGHHSVTFNGASLSSGMYIYKLTAGTHVGTGKMNLIK